MNVYSKFWIILKNNTEFTFNILKSNILLMINKNTSVLKRNIFIII